MYDIGKVIYFACSALLFIFAATTSVYLYGTLNNNIDQMANITNVYNRVEGDVVESKNEKRNIEVGEIYTTITNMEQMHIDTVRIRATNRIFTFQSNWSASKIRNDIKQMISLDNRVNRYTYTYQKTILNDKVIVTYTKYRLKGGI